MRLVVVFMLIIPLGCKDTVVLDFDRYEKRLAVEGTITDQENPYFIYLTYTAPYTYSVQDINLEDYAVSNATVQVEDDLGNTFNYDELSPGIYISDPDEFVGEIGRYYTLHILTEDGEEFISRPEKLNKVSAIDSLYYVVSEGSYQLLLDMQDPLGVGQYYQWKISFNDRLNDWINIAPDDYFDGNTVRGYLLDEDDYSSIKGAMVGVYQLSLTKEKYEFLYTVNQQLSIGGSPFDPPFAPIIGNVYNVSDSSDYALGYFGASAVSSSFVKVE